MDLRTVFRLVAASSASFRRPIATSMLSPDTLPFFAAWEIRTIATSRHVNPRIQLGFSAVPFTLAQSKSHQRRTSSRISA